MKKVLVMLTLVAAVSAYSQGTVNFNNVTSASNIGRVGYDATGAPAALANITGNINGAVAGTVLDGFTYGGPNARAGLYGGAPGIAIADMVLLVPSVPFKSGASAGLVNPGTTATRVVDGIPGGSPADFVIKAWDVGSVVDSYEAAAALNRGYLGQSIRYSITALGGAGSPPGAPANLTPLTPFNITWVPEPSIIGLGLLGAVAGRVVFRRRQ
jgi:hypothetical protein